LRLENTTTDEELSLEIDGIFIVGEKVPMTEIIQKAGVKIDERGCILVDRKQSTNFEGVFAAGDCTCGGMQIATAAGEGAMVAISATRTVK